MGRCVLRCARIGRLLPLSPVIYVHCGYRSVVKPLRAVIQLYSPFSQVCLCIGVCCISISYKKRCIPCQWLVHVMHVHGHAFRITLIDCFALKYYCSLSFLYVCKVFNKFVPLCGFFNLV